MADEKSVNVKKEETKYRFLQGTFFISKFASLFAPFVALGIANFDEWFINDEGWKVGIGGFLSMVVLGVVVFIVGKREDEKSKLTDGYVSLIVGWIVATAIIGLFQHILEQLFMIMCIGFAGIMGSFGFNIASNKMKQEAEWNKNIRETAKKNIAIKREEARQEDEPKKEKRVRF